MATIKLEDVGSVVDSNTLAKEVFDDTASSASVNPAKKGKCRRSKKGGYPWTLKFAVKRKETAAAVSPLKKVSSSSADGSNKFPNNNN